MVVKSESTRNGHELAPLNDDRQPPHNVTIVVSGNQNASAVNPEPRTEDNRAAWSGKMQFFLSIIGYSVGLGNIWRFPYLCQQNGGGAFLIPFFVMLILEGVPLFLIELGLGQRMRQGALGVWNTIHPWLGGIGIASCIVTFFVALYYNVIITWCFFYLFNSLEAVTIKFGAPLPWAKCPEVDEIPVEECVKSSETAYFWYRTTLDAAPSIEDGQSLKWWIVLCLLLSWIVVFFIVMKGIQSSGKVVYFTSMFPYLVLTIFFVRGITLKGASAGLAHMYTPKVEKLLEPTVWLDAATQVFYSFGLAFGSLIAFGSYNTPDNNCVRDVILVSVCNAFTAIYASVVIFAILGFKAMSNVDKCLESNKISLIKNGLLFENSTTDDYENVVNTFNSLTTNLTLDRCSMSEQLNNAAEGTGLAFIIFTQAIVELPGAPFWSCIFFLMLLALGLGSQIGIMEGMLCVIFDIDLFKRIKKQYITGVVCIVCFFVGLIFCTGAGEYWLKMFDSFAGTIGLVMVALMEMISVIFVYGHEKFTKDIEEMTGYRPGIYWQVTWRFLAPIIMVGILISSIASMFIKKPEYSAWNATLGIAVSTAYPGWVLAIAACIIVAGIAPIPIVFLLRVFQCVKLDVDIHQGSIRRIDTTVSTKEMMGDVDLDEYHDRLEDFPEEDEDVNSDDDNNSAPPITKMVPNKLQGRAFKMEAMEF
ncbi:sodium-dependent neutral amino acid transporter B(0)AT3 isoform X1 [Vespula pensylvanica]|uniref:sodium-dependent neutral amino acid transporter B(0)AT3 isoform X1 n=1 Tax=Vespula pensylvanica TaxID=30213 RepID=UPI001CB9ED3E|nr:sodium-dependent neutral amino acid transporter B(0)AT3 isoform X1 [Vespula pensylvanica]XP_043682334.1 sodium-dependent neutral amino acid transporter B(0)AT3 isoform X1 [Vespula pensylvanica]XP_050865738.1 sodium-dependent neutral amino acid transporter B(0)AT3 isoform X1 [Vespula vulgaris]XP_050865739.1 sodium-dependent neutral amino acid transporter B(0)AT3 isoform X1 [Vespula vulgaris]